MRAYVNNQPQKKPARRKKPAIPKVVVVVSNLFSDDLCGFDMKSSVLKTNIFPVSGFSLSPRRWSKCVFSFLQTLIFSWEMISQGKVVKAPDFQKEKEYFRDIDAFELLEASPSPNKSSTWTMGEQVVPEMPHLSTRLEKWLISKKLNHDCSPSSTLSKILENSATRQESICDNDAFDSLTLKTPDKSSAGNTSVFRLIPSCDDSLAAEDVPVRKIKMEEIDLKDELKRLSLTSNLISTHLDFDKSFLDLLSACGQTQPSNFMEAFSKFW